jgi:hypothetical protein
MKMKHFVLVVLLVVVAGPALAHEPSIGESSSGFGYPAGFGYHPQPYGSYRSHHRSGHRRPSREVTTITPLENGGRRIETRRYYDSGGRARVIGRGWAKPAR